MCASSSPRCAPRKAPCAGRTTACAARSAARRASYRTRQSFAASPRKKAHMTCELSPYSCMPNTMSIGAMGAVLGKHPDLLYAPLEIKGDAEVHALSRCQMILTEAKKRAQKEFQEVLDKTNLTEGKLREMADSHPEMKKATYRVPRYGVAGTAANLALHLASC
jgi:hypothetical protein